MMDGATRPSPVDAPADLPQLVSELETHIEQHAPAIHRMPGTRSPEPDDLPDYRRWCASLFDRQFLGADWPVEYGGIAARDVLRTHVVDDVLATRDVPRAIGAWNLVSAALIEFGSADQARALLPRIRSFEDIWCQLFSEPDAGSDLAAMRTSAVRTPDGWTVNGQKVWTTHAHIANMGFLLARTDPSVPKRAGISAFVMPMDLPGVEVRPLREMTGSSDFNEVFLDDVHLPADSLLGEPGQGWLIARTALAHERTASLREDSVLARVEKLATALATAGALDDAAKRAEVSRLMVRAQVAELVGMRAVRKEAARAAEIGDAPAVKLAFSEANLEVTDRSLNLLGPDALRDTVDAGETEGEQWARAFLFARGYTISAGSNEVMRNLIAERALGLPRSSVPGEAR